MKKLKEENVGVEFLPPPLHARVAHKSGESRVNSVHAPIFMPHSAHSAE